MPLPFIALVCLVCAPFFLLPTLAAFENRKPFRGVILVLNLLGLGVAPFYIPGVATALVIWLLLLHFALRREPPGENVPDEEITLEPYDPAWPGEFATERSRVSPVLADYPLEHVGSTAVPGLLAKPVIDMMLGLPSYPPTDDLLSRLGILGYENIGEAGVPGRVYLRLHGARSFNLHLVQRGGEHWTNNLALRELLRRDPVARERYAAGKQAAVAGGANRLLGYSAAKNPVVSELLAIARKA